MRAQASSNSRRGSNSGKEDERDQLLEARSRATTETTAYRPCTCATGWKGNERVELVRLNLGSLCPGLLWRSRSETGG